VISITSAPWTVLDNSAIRGGPTRELICICHGTVAERAGNARAISAVPAMIAALQAIVGPGHGFLTPDDIDRCRKALKQAGL
jgi:hypothetical protein